MRYKKCSQECKWRRTMVDVCDSTYKIEFCDFEMSVACDDSLCAYFTKKDDEDEKI